jgi:hypothetical protein
MESKYFTDDQFEQDVFPAFVRHLKKDHRDTSCDLKVAKFLGRFIHNIPLERSRCDKHFRNYVVQFLTTICSKDPEPAPLDILKAIAYNLPCFYKYFGKQESYSSFGTGDSINFGDIYALFTEESTHDDVKIIVGKGLHEVVREAEVKARNPFIFKHGIINLLKNETAEIQSSIIPTIGIILH